MDDQRHEKGLGWLAFIVDEGLRLGVLRPADLLQHATPEVLAANLPRDLMVKIFASAFSTGKLTPEGILAVAPPSTLVRHVAPAIVWACIRQAAREQHVDAPAEAPHASTSVRSWLGHLIAAGLERGVFTPADVTRHIPPRAWVHDVPIAVVARMMAAGLSRERFDAAVALEVLTPEAIGEHVAPHLTWSVIDEGAVRAFDLAAAAAAALPAPAAALSAAAAQA